MIVRLVKIGFFSILLAGVSTPTCSQHQHKLDSLQELVRIKSGIDKYDPTIKLAIVLAAHENYSKAILILKEAYAIGYRYGDTIKIIHSGRLMGQVFNRLNDHIEAIEILQTILPMARRAHDCEEDLALILNNLALVYTFQAVYDKALYYNFQTLEHWKTLNDRFSTSVSLNNIGLVYYKLSNYDKAIVYYNKALELKEELKDEYDLDRLLVNLSLSYVNKKDYYKAKECLEKALLICKENCSPQIITESLYANGIIAFRGGDLKLAETYFVKSYLKAIEISDKRFQLENILLLSRIYNKLKRYVLAKDFLKKAILIGSTLNYNSILKDVYLEFSSIYNETHDYKNAANYQAKYILLRDSLYGEELTQNLMIIQTEYEQRENKTKIESQNKVLALKEQIIKRQKILEIFAGITILLLTLLILALYRNNRQRKTINTTLEQKVQERTRELETSYTLIQKAYLDQKNFIEKAVNDIRGPLSTMKGLCTLGLKEVSESEAQEYLIQLSEATDQLADTVRKLASNREV